MNDFAPVNVGASGRISAVQRYERAIEPQNASNIDGVAADRASDRLEISTDATFIERLIRNDVLRENVVADAKSKMDDGTYDEPDVLDAALEELTGDL